MGSGREMDGCGRFMKYSMFIANFIIFIGGAIVLVLGALTLADRSFPDELLGTNLFLGAVYVLVATAAAVCIIALFGCLGASKEVKCMLLSYFIVVFLMFVLMLVGGVLGYVFREKVSTTMEQQMQSSLSLYGNRRPVTEAWDETQTRLRCCGVTSWRDWADRIPASCCRDAVQGHKLPCQSAPSAVTLYNTGCLNLTTTFVRDHAAVIGGAGVAVAGLMVFGMIFSCALFHMIE